MLPVYGHPYSTAVSEDDLALQHHFSQLCMEKCRLLSAIEASNREGRILQKEIQYVISAYSSLVSRILDFLSEMCPEDSVLSDLES